MQDGYHFANAPWLIGDGQPAPDSWDAPLAGAIRRGQVVRIVSEPVMSDDITETDPSGAVGPMVLGAASRLVETVVPLVAAEPVLAAPQVPVTTIADQDRATLAVITALATRQDTQFAKAEQALDIKLGLFEQRLLAALADRIPVPADISSVQTGDIQRDIAEIRSGLTELRVQLRLIEVQLFGFNRGYEGGGQRGAATDPLVAMLSEVLASRQGNPSLTLAS